MNTNQAMDIVRDAIRDALASEDSIDPDAPLIGQDALLDSMKLVEVCLQLEDKAEEAGFEFDWTSEETMSRSKSMFRTPVTLAEELTRQYTEQQ